MEYIMRSLQLSDYSVSNGDDAVYTLPLYVDLAQQFLISGYGWAIGPIREAIHSTYSYSPVLLPPWTGSVEVQVRAVGLDEGPVLTVDLRNSDNTATLSSYVVSIDGLIIQNAAPADNDAWLSIPWCGGGNVGQSTPAAGASMLQVVPSNAYVPAWIRVTGTDVDYHEIAYRCWASQAKLT